jgi:cytochrome c-type biogenesis protein CcmE
VRLVLALAVAGVLAVFLLYTSIAGGGNPSISPSELGSRVETVQLAGVVVGPVRGDAHASGLSFALRDISGKDPSRVAVLYTGSVPDLFKVGRHIVVRGKLSGDVFVAEPDSMVTKCPSKYTPKKTSDDA